MVPPRRFERPANGLGNGWTAYIFQFVRHQVCHIVCQSTSMSID